MCSPGRRRDATASLPRGRPPSAAPPGQRRNSPVARIDNQRRSPGRDNPGAPVPPRGVVADGKVGLGIAVAAIRVVSFPHPFFIIGRFRLREKLFPGELGRAFQRGHGRVGPDALQVPLALECSWRCPGRRRGLTVHRHRRRERHGGRRGRDRAEDHESLGHFQGLIITKTRRHEEYNGSRLRAGHCGASDVSSRLPWSTKAGARPGRSRRP